MSILEVASPIITILLLIKIALAMLTNCFSPDKHSFDISYYKSFTLSISRKPMSLQTLNNWESVDSSIGSKFNLRVPLNITESCGIIVIDFLRLFKGIVDISILSIVLFPSNASRILNNNKLKVDLQLPVLPTIPTFSQAFNFKFIFFKTK